MAMPRWSLLFHGGCANSCPETEKQLAIEQTLHHVAQAAATSLEHGDLAKDVVKQIIVALEDCPLFNAGKGSVLTAAGVHELEAGMVDGHTGAYGAVSCTSKTKNPILAAGLLLDHGQHCMLTGPAADALAEKSGLDIVKNEYFTTPARKQQWDDLQTQKSGVDTDLGTVGAVVIDVHGHLAAGGSTGGIAGKCDGRVGDTSIIGAGLLADRNVAVACSGAGDSILRFSLATKLAQHRSTGLSLEAAADRAVLDVGPPGQSCALIEVDSKGSTIVSSTAAMFYTASMSSGIPCRVRLTAPKALILPPHVVLRDEQLVAGLSRYATTLGHTVIHLRSSELDWFAQDTSLFLKAMNKVRRVSEAMRIAFSVQRVALIGAENNRVALLPLHGLTSDWKPFTSTEHEYHETYPNYLSSKDGLSMSASRLNSICTRIQGVSKIAQPHNYHFDGLDSDSNLFAQIIRGERPQSRIWEDENHVAFLTPYPNTPGFAVLVPRSHKSSDIFSLNCESYQAMMQAAYTVAQMLKEAFGVQRCGMIFEGLEIDYAHIKLVPIHEPAVTSGEQTTGQTFGQSAFHEEYVGHITSQDGPHCKDMEQLSQMASQLSQAIVTSRLEAPKSWQIPQTHVFEVLSNPWYRTVFDLQDSIVQFSNQFFSSTCGYKYALLPATTDAISSPMGLGSDSEPVHVTLLGNDTHLADSMQFALEYLLRIDDHLPGTYYIGCSFRGEDPDNMHLNQFHHVECELRGDLLGGVAIAEGYVQSLVSYLLRQHAQEIMTVTGNVTHLENLLELFHANESALPRITLDDALALPGMDSSTWKHVVTQDVAKGRTITRAGELKLIEHFGGACWLTDMDHLSVPFYQAYGDQHKAKAKCADLLLGNGEVLGLGERHRLAVDVTDALLRHEVPHDPYSWYCKIREMKPIQTTAWGLGTERFLAWVCNTTTFATWLSYLV